MKILFKQFFKSITRNIFLILSLSTLMVALNFVVAASINLSQSFSSSYNSLNNNSKKAKAVSDIPSDFGKLDFSYKLSNSPVNVYQSTLNLQPTNLSNNNIKYERINNTFFPYNKSDFYDGSTLYRNNSTISFDNGIDIIKNTNTNQVDFIFNRSANHPLWTLNAGLTYKPPPIYLNISKMAMSMSFVDDSGNIMLNPQNLIFNNNGIPFLYFDKGALTNEVSSRMSHATFNQKVIESTPNFYDANGVGIVENAFNRFDHKKGISKNLNDWTGHFAMNLDEYNFWNYDQLWFVKSIGRFIKTVSVEPYEFNFDLSSSGSSSKIIGDFVRKNPEVIEKAFNKIFHGLNRENQAGINGAKASSNISLKKHENNFSIILALPDESYRTFKVTNEKDGTGVWEDNKQTLLENFKIYLSNIFSQEIYNIFMNEFTLKVNDNNVNLTKESEYFVNDNNSSNSYLFVPKQNVQNDMVVINQGQGLTNNNFIEEFNKSISEPINGNFSSKFFLNFQKIINLIPTEQINKLDGKDSNKITFSTYNQFMLLKHCLNYVCNEINRTKVEYATPELLSSPESIMLTKMISWRGPNKKPIISFLYNKVDLSFIFTCFLESIFFKTDFNVPLFYNIFCVINNSFAIDNKKKFLPISNDINKINFFDQKINEIDNLKINDSQKLIEFSNWLKSISKTNNFILSSKEISTVFNKYSLYFNTYLTNLPSDYKISYDGNTFLINGFGMSPDYAYPIISPTSPIPSPKDQCLVYITNDAFKAIASNANSVFNYFTYYSKELSSAKIINLVNKISFELTNHNVFKVSKPKNATFLGNVWLRSYFPEKINLMIISFAIASSVFLLFLSLFTLILLTKAIIKNMVEPISVCIANGISIRKILGVNLIGIGIFASITSFIGFLISYFLQSNFLSIFSSVWFIPTLITSFNPLIFIPLILGTFGILAGAFSYTLYKKFKEPIPSILANKQSIKFNKLTNVLRRTKFKFPLLAKLSIGFGSVNTGKLLLLFLLSSISLATITSCVTINSKFNESRYLTAKTQKYNYDYKFVDINEPTGLYKVQEFEKIGFEDTSVGINDLFANNPKSPYHNVDLSTLQIPYHGDANSIEPNTKNSGKLTNMVLPSYLIYNNLKDGDDSLLFNSSASLFLLKLKFKIIGQDIDIWEQISNFFPNWIITRLEEQIKIFENSIMYKYGEWYYSFIDLISKFDKQDSIVIGNEIKDTDNSDLTLTLKNISEKDSGYYYAMFERNGMKYRTEPYYVWPNSKQWYWDSNITNIKHRFEPNLNSIVKIDVSNDQFFKYKNNNEFKNNKNKKPIALSPTDKVKWVFIPAYNNNHILGGKDLDISNGSIDPNTIRLSDEFLKFVRVIYSDLEISKHDSKLSFGIIPYNKYDQKKDSGDEKITKVLGHATFYNHILKTKKTDHIELIGIKKDSNLFKLYSNNNTLINDLLITNSTDFINNPIPVVASNGASLKYNLKKGSEFFVNVKNNSLTNSFEIFNNFVPMDRNPINTIFRFKVVDFNSEAFGTKFYIDQKVANAITSLDQMFITSSVTPQILRIKPNTNDYEDPTFPFNGIASKSEEMSISNNIIPFYTVGSVWNFTLKTIDLKSINNLFPRIMTENEALLRTLATSIKKIYDPTFNDSQSLPIEQLRNNIINFFSNNFSLNTYKKSLEANNEESVLQSSIQSVIPTETTNQLFDIISNLTSTLIIGSSLILVPLLLLVSITTCLSIVSSLTKNIGLMQVMGYSKRNVLVSLLLTLAPTWLVSSILGIGLLFALNYGIQFMIFNLTSIFIYPYVSSIPLIVGIILVALIFAISLGSAYLKLNRSKLETSIKF